jgi:ABC-type Na+ efflux pump permease subunit
MLWQAGGWTFNAKIVPLVVGAIAIVVAGLSLFNDMCRQADVPAPESLMETARHDVEKSVIGTGEPGKIHMDLESDTAHLPVSTVLARAAIFFGYLLAFMATMWVIGLIPTAGLFVVLFMRLEGRERWSVAIPYAIVLMAFIYVVFDQIMSLPWPGTLAGAWVPALRAFVPSL